jgi:hypothetical protein
MMKLSFLYLMLHFFFIVPITYGQFQVKYAGAQMKMRQGEFSPAVMLDTLPNKYHVGHLDEVAFNHDEPVNILIPSRLQLYII